MKRKEGNAIANIQPILACRKFGRPRSHKGGHGRRPSDSERLSDDIADPRKHHNASCPKSGKPGQPPQQDGSVAPGQW
jgi:hypothetical protein